MDETHTRPSELDRNNQHRRSRRECEKEVEDMKKDLVNSKAQLETKHAAYMQALRMVEHYQKLHSELFSLLKKSDSERKRHMNGGDHRRAGIDELESRMNEMDDHQVGNPKFRVQISQLLSELKTRDRMLLSKEVELLAAKDSELKALTKIEKMETAFNIEKEKKEQILQQLEELKVKEQTDNHTDKERNIMDQTVYIEALETELNQLKQELVKVKKEVNGLNSKTESLTSEAAEGSNTENDNDQITIPLKEYESLMRKVKKAATVEEDGSQSEAALLKMELEAATAKIGKLRARAEQALSRAESAEKVKAFLEDKLRRYREKKERRRAAMAALEEESTPKQFTPFSSEATRQIYEPLSKILNLKF